MPSQARFCARLRGLPAVEASRLSRGGRPVRTRRSATVWNIRNSSRQVLLGRRWRVSLKGTGWRRRRWRGRRACRLTHPSSRLCPTSRPGQVSCCGFLCKLFLLSPARCAISFRFPMGSCNVIWGDCWSHFARHALDLHLLTPPSHMQHSSTERCQSSTPLRCTSSVPGSLASARHATAHRLASDAAGWCRDSGPSTMEVLGGRTSSLGNSRPSYPLPRVCDRRDSYPQNCVWESKQSCGHCRFMPQGA